MNVGILALQGDFAKHAEAVTDLGHASFLVRTEGDISQVDALIIPGGESTTLQRLIDRFGLREPLMGLSRRGVPIMGTCAGLILLAKEVLGRPEIRPLGLLDISVERNAYGRQRESFEAPVNVNFGQQTERLGIFIRAPRITRVGDGVEVLAVWGSDPVMVRQGRILGLTFHPELSDDRSFHRYFLEHPEA